MAFGATAKVNLMQTACNNAATVTAALIQAGLVGAEESQQTFTDIRDQVFEDLVAVQESEPAQEAPARRSYNRGGGNSNRGGNVVDLDPATLKLKASYRKHAGKTLAEVFEADPSYVDWLANKCKDEWMNTKAKAFLAKYDTRSEDKGEFDQVEVDYLG